MLSITVGEKTLKRSCKMRLSLNLERTTMEKRTLGDFTMKKKSLKILVVLISTS